MRSSFFHKINMLIGSIRRNYIGKLDSVTVILICLCLLLITYTIIKASRLAFTHDESFSYLVHAQLPIKDILLSNGAAPANNHILNTLLIKFLSHFFGESELVLRIPSLFGHAVFLVSSLLIVKRLRNPLLILLGFVLLNFNPFILDFFHLSRGYGLGLGLMLASIVFFIKYIEKIKRKRLLFSIFFAYLSILANFAFLNYYVSLISGFVVIFFVQLLKKRKKGFKLSFQVLSLLREIILFLLVSILPILTVLPSVIRLKEAGEFYFGGDNSFWRDTVGSLIECVIYDQIYPSSTVTYLKIILIIAIVTAIFLVVFKFRKGILFNRYLKFFSIFLIMGVSILSTIVQHYLFDNKYLIQRTAIFYFPIFSLLVSFMFQQLLIFRCKLLNRIIYITVIFLIILFSFHLYNTINFTRTLNWYKDYDTKELIKDIIDYRDNISGEKNNITLASDWHRGPSISFYIKTLDLYWLDYDSRGIGKVENFDLYYCDKTDINKLEGKKVIILDTYPLSGYTLFLSE